LNYLDLFAGCGGFHLGLKLAGYKFDWVGYSEIDKHAIKIYKRHFSEAKELGDVRAIDPYKLPTIDILTFGFPCQDLSVAGKRRGIHAERSGLFFEAMRVIEAVKPKVFIFENVKGLLSSEGGEDFTYALRTIANIGLYECEWQLLNTRWFLPQNRERIYFIGHLRGHSRPKVFPIGEDVKQNNRLQQKREGEGARAQCLHSRYGQRWTDETYVRVECAPLKFLGRNQKNVDGDYAFMIDSLNTGGVRLYQVPRGYNKGGWKKDCVTLSANSFENNCFVFGIRKFTPLECERLQGFPDNWTGGLSDTQRYKLIGNAVSVPVVEEIGKRLLNADT
jgi:DNA (cytosine-5)-methyltransferase 1